MAVEVKWTNQLSINSIKIIVYGPAKIGKTRLAATAPSPFIVSTEKGVLSLRKDRVPYVEVSSIKELADIYCWMRDSKEARQFKTFCFDSVSDLAEIVLGDEKKKSKDGRKAYGNTNDTIMQIFRDFRDWPDKHVYFIAKEMQFVGANNLNAVRPTMPDGYLTTQLPYMFDIIAHYEHMQFQGVWYPVLNCRASEQVVAGDRSGALDQYEETNLANIFQKIAKS